MQSLQSEKKKALTREQSEKDSNGWLRRTQAHKEVPHCYGSQSIYLGLCF